MFEAEREAGGSRSRLALTHLATLVALDRRGTLAGAAASLGYTPGAASQHLSALERALGVRLTERSGRGVVLTHAGRTLVTHAVAILDAESDAVTAVRSDARHPGGTLRVGIWGSTAASLLSPVVTTLRRDFPQLVLRSREIDVDAAVPAVQRGEVDVAFGLDYPDSPMAKDDGVDVVLLHEETFTVAAARSVDDPTDRRVTTDELAAREWILPPGDTAYGRAFRHGCRRRGFEPSVVHEVTDTAASLQLAAGGSGVTPVTTLMRRLNRAVDLVELEMAEPVRRQVVLVSRARAEQRAALTLFTDAVLELVRQVLGGPELPAGASSC